MSQPSELLRQQFENNMLRAELVGLRLQKELDAAVNALREERQHLLEQMRKETGAGLTDLYNRETQMFQPRQE